MIKRLSIGQIEGINLVPVAAIAAPIEWFRNQGYTFDRDTDDLDRYEFAAFEVAGGGVFALMRYDHATDFNTNLLFEDRISGSDEFLSMMAAVAEEFVLPGALFRWHWGGQPVSLAEPATTGRDQAA